MFSTSTLFHAYFGALIDAIQDQDRQLLAFAGDMDDTPSRVELTQIIGDGAMRRLEMAQAVTDMLTDEG